MTDQQQDATRRSLIQQLRDAGRELCAVLCPAVLFGSLGALVAVLIGSILFSETWVVGLLAALVIILVTVPITLQRVYELGSLEKHHD